MKILQKTAIACANKTIYFDALWHELLESMLKYWRAEIKMDLWDATKVMLNSAGYHYGRGWIITANYDLWYKYENDGFPSGILQVINPCFHPFVKERAFKMTIAVFETINYWCYYTDPLRITLTKEELLNTLKYGRIHIAWNSYKFNL